MLTPDFREHVCAPLWATDDWQWLNFYVRLRKCPSLRRRRNWWWSWPNRRMSSRLCLMKNAMTISLAKVSAFHKPNYQLITLQYMLYSVWQGLYFLFLHFSLLITLYPPGERRLSYKALQGALMIYFYRYVCTLTDLIVLAQLQHRHIYPRTNKKNQGRESWSELNGTRKTHMVSNV